VLPADSLRDEIFASPTVMYLNSQRIKVTDGESLGEVYDPYFNRTYEHFCSHQHSPPRTEPSGFASGVRKGSIAYLAHPVFSHYRAGGAVVHRDHIARVIRSLMKPTVESNLPSTARMTLAHQRDERRYVLHLLYGAPSARGDGVEYSPEGYVRDSSRLEVIEDLPELHGTEVRVRLGETVTRVTLEPAGEKVAFDSTDGVTSVKVPGFSCHQMVVFHY
jgi:hypothetical protein